MPAARRVALSSVLGLILGLTAVLASPADSSVPFPGSEECFGSAVTIYGTDGADHITGTPGNDVIWAGDGDDVIDGGDGKDRICAGGGHDIVYGGRGNDHIISGDGGATIFGGSGSDRIFVSSDVDNAPDVDTDSVVRAGKGDDFVYPLSGNDVIHGGSGHDHIGFFGASPSITIDLAAGTLSTAGYTSSVAGIEDVTGGGGDDIIRGDEKDNRLVSWYGTDLIDGRGGHDRCAGTHVVNCEAKAKP